MAGQRLTDKTALEQQVGSGDLLMVVDVNDTTGSAQGTSKKMDFKYLMQTISATCLVTYAASTESSNKNLYLGFDDSSDIRYWAYGSRIMGSITTDQTYIFSGNNNSSGAKSTSIINSPLVIWSNGAFNGGWSMDVYITYAYTKVL